MFRPSWERCRERALQCNPIVATALTANVYTVGLGLVAKVGLGGVGPKKEAEFRVGLQGVSLDPDQNYFKSRAGDPGTT